MSISKNLVTCTRKFGSSPSLCAAMIKPPVAVFGVAGRYVTAFYSAAMKEKKIDAVEKDLIDLKNLVQKDKRFAEFIVNPLMKPKIKTDILRKVCTKKNYSPLTGNLLALLSENGRLKSLMAVLDCFSGVMSNIRGEISCEIVSAKPLDAPTLSEFEKALKAFVKKNEKVLLNTRVDPSLIGGVIVTIGDKYVDMSISSKIKAYDAVLREVV
ncbi:ATP synthase subunit O, mitochondrial [Parasteatoda tepidariorum]|uniref:ATP synthase subunit O, mitochondrial n=1 Tax=Parasteatoda tepidariorum TaxID=114398 RepID=UPI000A2C0884|nr:ATP synthase subunit O, mitochondrial [Parasteatoda tepidariorum]